MLKQKEPSDYDLAAATFYAYIRSYEAHDADCTAAAKNFETVTKAHVLANSWKTEIAKTVIGAGTQIITVLAVLNYEHVHVIATKAVAFIPKLKI